MYNLLEYFMSDKCDIIGNPINVGDTVVAPFGKDFAQVCEVIKIMNKTVKVKAIKTNREANKHMDSIVVIDSISMKLDALEL